MDVTYLDPTAEEGLLAESYELFLDTDAAFTLGLIANAFPDSARFMDKLESALKALAPHATTRRYQKPGVATIESDQLESVVSECDAVVAGWGH